MHRMDDRGPAGSSGLIKVGDELLTVDNVRVLDLPLDQVLSVHRVYDDFELTLIPMGMRLI